MMHLKRFDLNQNTTLNIPASKSISNRALIIKALCNADCTLSNLSTARDTNTMLRLLDLSEKEWDVLDAGTTMRFLTAFAGIKGLNKVLTGTERMQNRPISILVEALEQVGVEVKYLKSKGYPPIEIIGSSPATSANITMKGNVSSQYISAMMMIGNQMKEGLEITLTSPIYSQPYIDMTLKLMQHFGAKVEWKNANTIKIYPGSYAANQLTIEPDWSGASYSYGLVSASQKGSIYIEHLSKNSLQGDAAMADIGGHLGVKTTFDTQGASLSPTNAVSNFEYNFKHCPDLAQTVMVACAANGINATFYGLESLKIKETDRVAAMQKELSKLKVNLIEDNEVWRLDSSNCAFPDTLFINTYDDHRMAMAFAPLALKTNLTIEEESVVNKSYPSFWSDLEKAGLKLD